VDIGGAGAGERRLGNPPLRAAVDHPEFFRRVTDDDIIGDAELGDQRQLLEDGDDAGLVGGCRRRENERAAFHRHAPFIGRHHAGHHLDQRRLAGAVLT
jgi:hypothetical protein